VKQKWDTEIEDLVEVISADQRKCIRQFARIVARNAKFLSNQAMIQTESQDLYIAGIATRNINHQEGSKLFNFLVK
jgi:hypothetical protein